MIWSYGPKILDPIEPNAKDQDIVDRAIQDKSSKWTLPNLAKEMGDYYDFSEIPTVVYHGSNPVVYDGNRRIILAKIKHGIVNVKGSENINIPEIPQKVPCNVCDKITALKNVYRKHAESGSWSPLNRDIFLHKFFGKDKSTFLKLEENTGIISANPELNKDFVRREIFNPEKLKSLGFQFDDDNLVTTHSDSEAKTILSDIASKVKEKDITTRGQNRGKVYEVLEKSSRNIIEQNKQDEPNPQNISFSKGDESTQQTSTKANKKSQPKQTKRTEKQHTEIFGGKLYLIHGSVNDLCRDIRDIYFFYLKNKSTLSKSFPSFIRMSLRLVCESAAYDEDQSMDDYIKSNFEMGKNALNKNEKTELSTMNVTKKSIIQLLHVGAHNYQAASNLDQTIAMSIIIGEILTITHGKQNINE